MDSILKPKELSALPNEAGATEIYIHWLATLEGFIESIEGRREEGQPPLNKRRILINCVSAKVYVFIADALTYELAKGKLDRLYKRKVNDVYARHLLATRRQNTGETIQEFIQALETLAKNCQFVATTAEAYKEHMLRDSLINGLASSCIRQRLLEKEDLTYQQAVDIAETLIINESI